MDSERSSITLALHQEKLHSSLLVDWFNQRYPRRLIQFRGNVWFVKCKTVQEYRRDRLAALLGKGLVNIATVEPLKTDQFSRLLSLHVDLPAHTTSSNTYFVKFGPDLDDDDLPIKDPDKALAHELLFSLWIRRRDAHSFNRVYRGGVPVFFDSGTAFLGEPNLMDLNQFFRPGPDPGYAGLWRVCEGNHSDLETLKLRARERESFSGAGDSCRVLFPVVDRDNFLGGLESCRQAIAQLNPSHITAMIEWAGFPSEEGKDVFRSLVEPHCQLDEGYERLCSTLFSSD